MFCEYQRICKVEVNLLACVVGSVEAVTTHCDN